MAIVKLPRRKFFHLAAAAAALPAVSRIVRAQTYPTRPVRIVVGFTVGGKAAERRVQIESNERTF
jgi:tripartite-type tricarboxylate transporter receptor subunit TctC